MTGKIFILDEIVVKPGQGAAFRDVYMREYAPEARARGMQFEHARITPPFEWREGSNTLHFLWSVAGIDGWWGMRIGGVGGRPVDTAGTENGDWWLSVAPMIVSRRRDTYVDFAGEGDAACSS